MAKACNPLGKQASKRHGVLQNTAGGGTAGTDHHTYAWVGWSSVPEISVGLYFCGKRHDDLP